MQFAWNYTQKNSDILNLVLDLLKIGFIAFFAFSVVAQMWPYFSGPDSYLYGTTAIKLANGSWAYSNDLLKQTGLWEFVPYTFTKTIQNDAVPIGGLGMHGFATLAYIFGGQYGLLYLEPLFTILLLVLVERIAFTLFNRFVSFVAVLLVGTSYWLFAYGVQLYSESIFACFSLVGIYFLIKFHRKKNNRYIFTSSVFLASAALIRANGVTFFPLEIFLFLGILIMPSLKSQNPLLLKKTVSDVYHFCKLNRNSILRCFIVILIPWIGFFAFNGIYNYYFFGDPRISSYESRPPSELEWSLKTAIEHWSADIFTWFEYNAVFLTPDKLFSILSNESSMLNVTPWSNIGIGWIPLLLISLAVLISFLAKDKRVEIVTFGLFIGITLVFYALGHMSRVASVDEFSPRHLVIADPRSSIRYMIPAIPLFSILFAYVIYQIWKLGPVSITPSIRTTFIRVLKFGFLALVVLFLFLSFYDSFIFKEIPKGYFANPQKELDKHFPIDKEGLSEKSIIVGLEHYKTLEYGFVPFYPYWGFNFERVYQQPELIPQEPITTLKILLGDDSSSAAGSKSALTELEGYSVFVFKDHIRHDTSYLRYLESNHGIVLKDFSTSFCKMELASKLNSEDAKSDSICY